MVEGSTLALAGIGGLVAAEATGVTNFSGGGGSGPNMKNPLPPTLPGSSGPGLGELMAIAEGMNTSGESVTRVINTGGGSSGMGAAMASAMAQMQESQNKTLATILSQTQNSTDTVTRYIPTDIPGTGGTDRPGPTDGGDDPGSGGNSGPGGWGLTDQQTAAAMTGRDPFGLQATTEPGSPVNTAAEALRATGETVTDVAAAPTQAANWAGKSGRTFGEAVNLLTTGTADTSGTFQEGRGKVGLDFSGDGEPGGKLTDRLPDFKLSDSTVDVMKAGVL